MRFSDKFTVKAPKQEVWKVVSDLPKVVSCFPNIHKLERLSDEEIKVTFRLDLSGAADKRLVSYLTRISSRMNVRFAELSPPDELRVRAEGSVAGSKVAVNLAVKLDELPDGSTQVSYDAEAEVGLLARILGAGLIQGLVNRNAEAFIQNFRQMLEKA